MNILCHNCFVVWYKKRIEELVKQAKKQLETYEKDELVEEHLHQAKLKKIILVFHGWKLVEMREIK